MTDFHSEVVMDVAAIQRIIERELERQHGDHIERKAGFLLVTANVAINCEDIAKEVAAAVRAYIQVH